MAVAGVPIDLANFANAMRVTNVFPQLTKQYLVLYPLLKLIQREAMTARPDGRTAELNVETRGATSIGGQLEHEQIAPADMPGYDRGSVTITTLTSTFELSLQSMLMSQRQVAAFVSSKVAGMKSVVEMFMQNFSRILWGYGDGAIAQLTTLTTDTGPGGASVGTHKLQLAADQASTDYLFGAHYMLRGLRLSNSTTRSGTTMGTCDVQVVSVDRANDIVYVQGILGDLANSDYIFFTKSKGRLPLGVMAALDDTLTPIYHGIDRSAVGKEYFKPFVKNSVGAVDLENHIQERVDTVYAEGGGETDMILMELAVWRRFTNDLRGGRHFIPGTDPKYVAGASMIRFVGAGNKDIAIGRDRDVPKGTATGFNFESWALGEIMPTQWVQFPGEATMFRNIPRTFDWYAVYGWMGNLICRQPNANWLSRGISRA